VPAGLPSLLYIRNGNGVSVDPRGRAVRQIPLEWIVRRVRPLSATAAVTAVALALTGCGGGSSDSGGDSGAGEQASATENQINPVDRDQLTQGGSLRWALAGMPANFNYHQLDGSDDDNEDVLSALMPEAFEFSADSTPSVNEDYFTSIEVTSEDPQVIEYTINPDAVWSDGSPITAADLIAQWQALNGSNPAFSVVSTTGYEEIASVEQGSDDRQAVVTFTQPYADWQAMFSPLYPAAANTDPNVFNTGWISGPQVTAGPFQVDDVDTTAQTITLVPNPDWWGTAPLLDSIVYRVMDPDTAIDALANGEIDFVDIGADVNAYTRATTLEGVDIRRAGGPNFRHITLNGTSPVLSDVNVRQALAKAIDRQTIADAMLGPLGADAAKLDNHIFMSNQEGYQDNAGDLSSADVAAANAQLDAAGWTREGDATRTKDGQELVIRFVIPSGVSSSQQESELVQGMLQEVGARVDIQTVPVGDLFDRYVTPGDFDMTVFSWLGTNFPISSSSSIYEQPQGDQIQQNYARIGTPEIDQLFQQAAEELNPVAARDIANQIDAAIWEEVHSLTLYQRPDLIAADSTLANFGAFGFADVHYEDIGFTG
jgi:peptide/nickel transport system substrate-binding protein